MSDSIDMGELQQLRQRIDNLEKENQAQWEWIKALTSQDSMLLQLSARLLDRTPEWAAERERILSQIIDNNRTINNLPAPENDE